MHAPTLLLASLLATAAAATNNSVILPNDEHTLQYTRVAFENLPTCASNTWDIAGPQYDTYSRCTTKPDVILGINVFRCRKYAATAKKTPKGRDANGQIIKGSDNVYNCDECFYGYRRIGPGGPQEIEPLTLDGYKAHNLTGLRGYFVPQRIGDRNYLRSCFLTEGKNLGDLCESIHRQSFGQADGADATCILKHEIKTSSGHIRKSLPFDGKLKDDDNCHEYAIVNNKIACKTRK
ncbi:hypothetical protein SPRG_02780 [Saprolegnia parasitica CBS 223.65]|uniref:Uncharacterized protein n=1 Tax=Saprolegnia parasitica (strain CBS 223.65) TaxID=695850 RepID=A0A067D0L6_SAPPC|nr:hypothetical protein SPRG_02780 [Saprolegnia parasitica CBS 223.65]KDO32301.1 hypothetical protein SPRG_02780 [Saprolegnia parasitica CBS 223.65]|eukprot:XP_012196757.1 hypothetical protein SPRG_02780 [Saprolegnia parasitica CBS 223.65]